MGPNTSPVCFIHLIKVQVNCHPNPAAQKPYLPNESRKLRGGSEGAHELGTPQVLRAAGVRAIHCHNVKGHSDTLRKEGAAQESRGAGWIKG